MSEIESIIEIVENQSSGRQEGCLSMRSERLLVEEIKMYNKVKRCCTVCDAKRKCHVCGDPTEFACSDCAISFGATVYVCAKSACRDGHDQAAISHVSARSIQTGVRAVGVGSLSRGEGMTK